MLFYFYAIISYRVKTVNDNCFLLKYYIAIIEQMRYIKGTKGEEVKNGKRYSFQNSVGAS